MSKVGTAFSMSLDGFVAGPNDTVEQVFLWLSRGDTEFEVPSGDRVFKVARASAEFMQKEWSKVGALVTGRRLFDLTKGWGGKHPLDVPVFVVTHSVPQDWPHRGAHFTFVTDGVESAIAQAKAAAGGRNVAVASTTIVQQCLEAGLLDEIHIDLVPFLLGHGIRLFDFKAQEPIELETMQVVEGTGVTHLHFRVVKEVAKQPRKE